METWQYLGIGLALFLGSAVQSAVGFAFGLFSITILLLMGLPPSQAIPLVAIGALVQTGVSVWMHRAELRWRAIAAMAALGIAFQPVGVWLLQQLDTHARAWIKPAFGIILLVVVLAQWLIRPRPHPKVHWSWGVLAMATGGTLMGLAGMGGPPIVLWVMAHDWSSQRSRATLWCFFLCMIPTNLLFFYHRFGPPVLESIGLGAAYLPVVLLGIAPGLWLGRRIPKPQLRRITFILLVVIAAWAIAQPLMGRLVFPG